MSTTKKLKTGLAKAGADWFGGTLVAALLALLGVATSKAGAEANLTTAEIPQAMRDVVSDGRNAIFGRSLYGNAKNAMLKWHPFPIARNGSRLLSPAL